MALINSMSMRGKLTLAACAVGFLIAVALIFKMATAPSYVTVMSGVDPTQSGEITSALSSAGISASQRITQRFTLFGGYSWRDYSDDNSAHDLLIAPSYTLYTGDPTVRTGYRFRYLNFDRQSFGGYFDPNDFISHQLFVSVDWQLDRIFLYAEPYGGFQSFDRYGDHTDDIFGGFSGTLGYRFTKRLTGEVNGELGNYALGATSGFEYYSVGTRFAYSF